MSLNEIPPHEAQKSMVQRYLITLALALLALPILFGMLFAYVNLRMVPDSSAWMTTVINMGLGAVLGLILAMLGVYLFTRWIHIPLQILVTFGKRVARGHYNEKIDWISYDEIGLIAQLFNDFCEKLSESKTGWEQRVNRRAKRLEMLIKLSERLNADIHDQLDSIANAIQQGFEYYHVQIYLMDEHKQNLVIAGASGEVGAQLKAIDQHIPLDSDNSPIGRAVRTRRMIQIKDVSKARHWKANPLLPDTKSEIALPIMPNGTVVGILNVQQDVAYSLTNEDISLIQLLVNQIGNALTREVESLPPPLPQDAPPALAQFHQDDAPLGEEVVTVAHQHLQAQPQVVDNDDSTLIAPIKLHDTVIGHLQLHDPGRAWTDEELALIQAVMEQVAQSAEKLQRLNRTTNQS